MIARMAELVPTFHIRAALASARHSPIGLVDLLLRKTGHHLRP